MYRKTPTVCCAGARRLFAALALALLALAACGAPEPRAPAASAPTPTTSALMEPISPVPLPTATVLVTTPRAADVIVTIDPSQGAHPISPLIYGLNGATPEVLRALQPALNRWGGNTSTRYNWRLGNAWNAGSDWFYRNGDYDYQGESASDDFVAETKDAGAAAILTVPTLGWVAKNSSTNTCSFPSSDGGCGDAEKANCENPGAIADPKRANVRSDVDSVLEWLKHLGAPSKLPVRFVAMDNEPDLWGYTHYDVHPDCTTYAEMRDTYLEYAAAVRKLAPEAELLGPSTCCWYFYWNSPAGPADRAKNGDMDFLPWFLQQVRQHDQRTNMRTLDVLDIHYYPEGLYNDKDDAETAAHRLRSTRSLWDKAYADESWIDEPIALIPRMKELIERYYPGTKLGISEWNWGADKTMNGALALADVLGILGREDVYLANYWRYPEPQSPGFFAFKLYTNFDDLGGRFGDTSIAAKSDRPDRVSAYAGFDQKARRLTVMLINKDPQRPATVLLDPKRFGLEGSAELYRYSASAPQAIGHVTIDSVTAPIQLPAYSLSLLVIEAKQP